MLMLWLLVAASQSRYQTLFDVVEIEFAALARATINLQPQDNK